ncbi:uncharacterized protein PRCAT00002493001 [Priceomyces carsonii]|uniref:uncharacterized protein n=1 Tax=Priceomyces carsonii TaxID=28549 RepID=UPI002EDAEBFB|nr:unnamed protein product [Priceomyces carsonii]
MAQTVDIKALKDTKIFEPIRIGDHTLSNRVVFAPTTRRRALDDHTPSDLQLKYYSDRSEYAGSLLITEGTFVSEEAGLYTNVPGIWNQKQEQAWRKITDKVHENGSYISCQLWNLGRTADPVLLKERGYDFVSSSVVYTSEDSKRVAEESWNPLRALKTEEIEKMVNETYVNAAERAIKAGFDYIELHCAHGYLLDQFLQPCSNKRTDKYGGSIENRARVVLEIVDKLIETVGSHRIGLRISPWAKFQNMLAEKDEVHPITTFSYLLHELQRRADKGNELAYISIVEPRAQGSLAENRVQVDEAVEPSKIGGDNSFVYNVWKGAVLRTGNYTYDVPNFFCALADIEDDRTLIGFSKFYTSNPDFVHRLKEGLPLNHYDRSTFYAKSNWGYNTFLRYGERAQIQREIQEAKFPTISAESS